jgi:ribosomal protein L37AE/L43A
MKQVSFLAHPTFLLYHPGNLSWKAASMNPSEPSNPPIPPAWAPRLKQSLIRRLYEADAQGIHDDELLDEVGWGLRARCESFITAVEAARGRVKCPECGQVVLHQPGADEILRCSGCGWEMAWRAYFKTFQHKQLSGAEAVLALFGEFVAQFPAARTPQEKMLLIDRLIHGFHYNLQFGFTRAAGVNLIEGNYHEVVDFLDRLTYGEGSTPGTRAARAEWREILNQTAETWNDERLRRKPEE